MFRFIPAAALSAALVLGLGQSAQALVIGVGGNNSTSPVSSFLTSAGHTVTDFGTGAALPGGAGSFDAFDVVVLMRGTGNADLESWIRGGGALVTEWNATWALNTANLLNATDSGHPPSRSGVPVQINASGVSAGLDFGMNNPFIDSGRTDHYRTLTSIGAGVETFATWSDNSTPLVIGGAVDDGYAIINTLDWADGFSGANVDTRQFLLNMVQVAYDRAAGVPLPAPPVAALLVLGLAAFGATRRRAAA